MKDKRKSRNGIILLVVLLLAGCATYYQKSQEFQQYLMQGNFQKADSWLEKNDDAKDGKNRLLYFLNHGYVSWMLDNHQESNRYFSEADRMIEDYVKNYGMEALALVSNPSVKPYKPEDFEAVMLHYYTSLNYISLNNYEDALVECRRVNLRLHQLNDKYKDHKNKYQRDAFAHNLMGMIYEADNDYNNAFIAYRNAYEVYKEDYNEYFGMNVPEQLKYDILRTAHLTGFNEEVRYYEKQFGIDYKYKPNKHGEVIFFWLNGFGPVKDEWSIQFTKVPNSRDGYVTLENEQLDMSFPVYIGDKSEDEKNAFKDLRFFKVAFPKYVERKPVYTKATVSCSNDNHSFEMAQDINEIAFKTLRDRMIREMANAILRIATKKALEALADEQNENLGTLVNIINTVTEKADTRNWQTLPYSISYARIPLHEGKNTIIFKSKSPSAPTKRMEYTFKGQEGKIYFQSHHTISSHRPRINH
jgi:hypothetical protein